MVDGCQIKMDGGKLFTHMLAYLKIVSGSSSVICYFLEAYSSLFFNGEMFC